MFHALIALALLQTAPGAPPQDAAQPYFPPPAAQPGGKPSEINAFESEWFSRHLRAAGEPSLFAYGKARKARAVLRFTWLRTFHQPVVLRVEGLDTDAPQLVAKQLTGKGGYHPGEIAREITRPLTQAEADDLRATLRRTTIFATPAPPEMRGLDGAQWIFESVDAGGYRVLNRWTPDTGPVHDMGMAMLALTGWEYGEVY